MRPVHSFGVCTPRCCAAAVDRDAHVLTAPLGPFVVRWDLRSLERIAKFDVHEDVIVSLIRVRLSCWPEEAYLTCSFGGHLRLWNDDFEPYVSSFFRPPHSAADARAAACRRCSTLTGNRAMCRATATASSSRMRMT